MADTRTKSDINLGRKGQAVADTRINRLTEWLTDSVSHFFCEESMAKQEEYKKPNYGERIKLQRFLIQLHFAAVFFKKNFVGKVMYYHTESNVVEVYFSPTNFMHLCGIYYQKGPGSFFDDCLANHISIDQVSIKKDGTTMQKLQVLGAVQELVGTFVCLTGSGKYLRLEFDYSLRTRKQILALTLKDTQSKIVPQSLLILKSKEVFPKGDPVTCIYSKSSLGEELKQHFLNDGLDWDDYL